MPMSLTTRNTCIIIGFIVYLLCPIGAHGKQVLPLHELQKQHKPASFTANITKQQTSEKNTLDIPPLDMHKLILEDTKSTLQAKNYRFAVAYEAQESYTDMGIWTIEDSTAIWTLNIKASGSHSLNLGFKDVFFPVGSKLFIYTEDLSEAVVFTHDDNKDHQELWSPVLESDNITIEINVPLAEKNNLHFNLYKINQGYRSTKNIADYKSGSCNNDVVCPVGDAWQNEARSVARYSISGAYLCSGTLVNNTNEDGTPYFLTADHCGVTSTTDASVVVYWNYQTSICGGTPDGSLNQFQTGSTFKASWSESDFTLIELDDLPSPSANVHYAGWDNSDIAPSSAVGIHHPNGNEKRISFDDEPLTITHAGSSIVDNNANYLKVSAWNDGTTEPGSSGSAIWNSNKHIVGTLTSGLAACVGSVDNDLPDWYGRFAKHWNGDGTACKKLSTWLDPDNTLAVSINGIDASAVSNTPIINTLSCNSAISPNTSSNNSTNNTSSDGVGKSGLAFITLLSILFFRKRFNISK